MKYYTVKADVWRNQNGKEIKTRYMNNFYASSFETAIQQALFTLQEERDFVRMAVTNAPKLEEVAA